MEREIFENEVTDNMKQNLVEVLLADKEVSPRWTAKAARAASNDPDNWEQDSNGNVRPNVIAASDDY